MLLPAPLLREAWRRILHDQTADRIVEIVSQLPHVNATIVPFHVARRACRSRSSRSTSCRSRRQRSGGRATRGEEAYHGRQASSVPGAQPIASLQWRTRARVAGRVKTIRVQPLSEVPTIECVVADGSGEAITFVFLGRRSIAGLRNGTLMVGRGNGRQAQGQARHDQPVVRGAGVNLGEDAGERRARGTGWARPQAAPATGRPVDRGRRRPDRRGAPPRSRPRPSRQRRRCSRACGRHGGHRVGWQPLRGLRRGPWRRRRSTSSSPAPMARSGSAVQADSRRRSSLSWSGSWSARWPPVAGVTE